MRNEPPLKAFNFRNSELKLIQFGLVGESVSTFDTSLFELSFRGLS